MKYFPRPKREKKGVTSPDPPNFLSTSNIKRQTFICVVKPPSIILVKPVKRKKEKEKKAKSKTPKTGTPSVYMVNEYMHHVCIHAKRKEEKESHFAHQQDNTPSHFAELTGLT